jgi:hypothetical protein
MRPGGERVKPKQFVASLVFRRFASKEANPYILRHMRDLAVPQPNIEIVRDRVPREVHETLVSIAPGSGRGFAQVGWITASVLSFHSNSFETKGPSIFIDAPSFDLSVRTRPGLSNIYLSKKSMIFFEAIGASPVGVPR